jgi:hypothetical protein
MVTTVFTAHDDAIIKLDDNNGDLQDVTESVATVSLDATIQIGENAVLTVPISPTTEGKRSFNGNISVYESTDANSAHHYIVNWLLADPDSKVGLKTLQIQTPNADSGSYQYDMEIRPASANLVAKNAQGDGSAPQNQLAYRVHQIDLTLIT